MVLTLYFIERVDCIVMHGLDIVYYVHNESVCTVFENVYVRSSHIDGCFCIIF